MAISYVSSATAGGNTTTLNVTWPAGGSAPAAGDVAILIWGHSSGNTVTVDPSGFTLEQGQNSAQGSLRTRIYYKVCAGTESGTLAMTMNGTNRQVCSLVIYRGCDQTDPINAISFRNEGASAVTSHVCPAVTPAVAGCVILSLVGERLSTGSSNYTTTPYTERADSGSLGSGSGGTTCAVGDDGLATSHSSGSPVTPPDWVGNVAAAGVTTWSLALLAAASGSQVTGTAAATFAFTGTAVGKRTVNGAAAASSSLSASMTGGRTVNGTVGASASLAASATGRRTVYGSATASPSLAATASGVRTVSGSAAASATLTASATGVRTVNGAASAALTATATATGTRNVTGIAAANLGDLAATISGTRQVSGPATSSLILDAAIAGTRQVNGTAAVDLGPLIATISGGVPSGAVEGTAVADLGTLTATASGTRTVHGTAAAALGALAAAATGRRTVNGAASAALGELSAVAVGTRTVHGVAAASFGALASTATGTRTVCGSAFHQALLTATIRSGPATPAISLTGTATVRPGLTGTGAPSAGLTGAALVA